MYSSTAQNVAALLTVGGWTGSRYFSTAVASAESRTAFANAVLQLVDEYKLDGVDFEYVCLLSYRFRSDEAGSWEYPNKQGMGCNVISDQDTPNFLAFLQELRSTDAGKNMTVTAASSIVPFASPDGTPSADVSPFAEVLDYVALMGYDIWGTWSSAVGPNAPLDDTCAPAAYQQGSAVSGVKAWTSAGFPANKIVLGVGSYGHGYHVERDAAVNSAAPSDNQPPGTIPIAAYPAFDNAQQPLGDSWDAYSPAGVDVCGNPTSAGGPSGIFNFRGLIDKGLLDHEGNPAQGMGFRYDECSQTVRLIFIPDGEIADFNSALRVQP